MAIKYFAAVFLFCLGIAGYVACRADTSPPDVMVYQSTIAADGMQHVWIEGGSYFFKPNRVIAKVNVPVELAVSVSSSWIPHTMSGSAWLLPLCQFRPAFGWLRIA